MAKISARKKKGAPLLELPPDFEPLPLPATPIEALDAGGPQVPATPRPDALRSGYQIVRGLACRRCGCCDSKVISTRPLENKIIRTRICRHCGATRHSTERYDSAPPPSPAAP